MPLHPSNLGAGSCITPRLRTLRLLPNNISRIAYSEAGSLIYQSVPACRPVERFYDWEIWASCLVWGHPRALTIPARCNCYPHLCNTALRRCLDSAKKFLLEVTPNKNNPISSINCRCDFGATSHNQFHTGAHPGFISGPPIRSILTGSDSGQAQESGINFSLNSLGSEHCLSRPENGCPSPLLQLFKRHKPAQEILSSLAFTRI